MCIQLEFIRLSPSLRLHKADKLKRTYEKTLHRYASNIYLEFFFLHLYASDDGYLGGHRSPAGNFKHSNP